MKMKSLILIFIALGCGLVASIGISQVMSNRGSDKRLEMDQILVAKDPIDSGKKLDATMVQLEDWPKQRIPDGAIRKVEEIEGKFTSLRLYKGEPILQAKISDKLGGTTGQIPPGYRVSNIKVDEDTVMEAITPGDTVDVSVFLEAGKNGIAKTGVYPILRNVRVFAKGGQTERSVDERGQEVKARTVSLLVKPQQWQELFLAYRLGKISLALRPPSSTSDGKNEELEGNIASMQEILSGKSKNATDSNGGGDSGAGAGSLLNSFLGNGKQSSSVQGKSITVLNPKGATRFTFPDDGGAPVEEVLFGSGTSPETAPPEPAPQTNPAPGATAPSGPTAGANPTFPK